MCEPQLHLCNGRQPGPARARALEACKPGGLLHRSIDFGVWRPLQCFVRPSSSPSQLIAAASLHTTASLCHTRKQPGCRPITLTPRWDGAENATQPCKILVLADPGPSRTSPGAVCREMVDAMQQSSKYSWAYSVGFLYSYVLTMPHSVAVNLAYPDEIPVKDNVYGLLPVTTVKKVRPTSFAVTCLIPLTVSAMTSFAHICGRSRRNLQISVWLMIVHQFIAWSLYVTPLLFMCAPLSLRAKDMRTWLLTCRSIAVLIPYCCFVPPREIRCRSVEPSIIPWHMQRMR